MSQPTPHARGLVATWGSTSSERARAYPCDPFLPGADATYFRAVDVAAPAAVVYRWLCQLQVAPYSYDWLDNGGKHSPRHLIPGLEQLTNNQHFMGIFTLVAHEPGQHITLLMTKPSAISLFGNVAITYIALPTGPRRSRLVAKLLVRYPRRGLPRLMPLILPWGDLIMMRKELRTLKRLAEHTARLDDMTLAAMP